jgi:RNA polymerase sigma factor (sigma-70 family)
VRLKEEVSIEALHPTSDRLPPFERVVELYGPPLLRYCAAQVGSERAEDCLQETLLAALRAYRRVREVGAIRSWLFSIAANKAVDLHRGRARAPEPVGDLTPPGAAGEPSYRDDSLWSKVRELPDKQRQAVTLRYLGDLSHSEIAQVMETSQEAARRSVFEGLERLRKEVIV